MNLHEIYLAAQLAAKNGDLSDYYSKNETDQRITSKVAEIVAGAPDDFDTLKEMSDWINEHEDSAAAMNSAITTNTVAISAKVDKVAGKGLSTNDFTNADKTKLDSLNNYDDTSVQEQIDEIRNQLFGLGTVIPTNADLNNYTTPGVWYAPTSATSTTLLNCPITVSGFRLEIHYTSSTIRFDQILYPNTNLPYFFIRRFGSNGWSAWHKVNGEAVTTEAVTT